jgi:hypothetical protein
MNPRLLAALAILLGATALVVAQTPRPAEPVIVALNTEAGVDAKLVRIENIAYLNGGSTKLRELIGRLDLVEIPDGATLAINREEVKFRMLVAGISEQSFRITGAQRCITRRNGVDPSSAAPNPERPETVVRVRNEEPAAEGPVVIKSRDRVKMFARIGPAAVLAAGEAQQDGRLGQSIRLRNIDSSKIVTGRVLGPGTVEVEY